MPLVIRLKLLGEPRAGGLLGELWPPGEDEDGWMVGFVLVRKSEVKGQKTMVSV